MVNYIVNISFLGIIIIPICIIFLTLIQSLGEDMRKSIVNIKSTSKTSKVYNETQEEIYFKRLQRVK